MNKGIEEANILTAQIYAQIDILLKESSRYILGDSFYIIINLLGLIVPYFFTPSK